MRGGGGNLNGRQARLLLPPGYRLDRSDPDVWALRRPEGWIGAYFSARGATEEAIWPEESTGGGEETFELIVFSSYEIEERAPYLGETRPRIGDAT